MHAKTARLAKGSHVVALLVYDGLSMFEFAVACRVFGSEHPVQPGQPWYQLMVCGPDVPSVTLDSGLRLDISNSLVQAELAGTVVVPPLDDPDGIAPEVVSAVRAARDRGARVVSLCNGAFVLAAAGLLDGRRATTHWAECAEMARRYPDVRVDPDVLYVDDGDVLTSAGSAASLDLCLHLVRQDHGSEAATALARDLVVPPYRAGGQAQYIDVPIPVPATSDLFAHTMAWVQENLDQPISVSDLADRSAMSRRSFARHFVATTGTTPYQWLVRQRLQLAQRLLETTDLQIEAIAARSGFGEAVNLRKHFARVVRTTPQAYRRTFQTPSGRTTDLDELAPTP